MRILFEWPFCVEKLCSSSCLMVKMAKNLKMSPKTHFAKKKLMLAVYFLMLR